MAEIIFAEEPEDEMMWCSRDGQLLNYSAGEVCINEMDEDAEVGLCHEGECPYFYQH